MTSLTPDVTSTIASKPRSNILKGYGLKERNFPFSTIADQHGLRDNFRTSTWLLIGASLQCLPLALPIRPSYALLPALLLLGYRFVNGLLMCFGIISHPYADGVILGKASVAIPESYDIDGKKKDDGGICVIMLFGRCNSPLGMFAPHFKDLAANMQSLVHDLDVHAPSNGFLGGNSWLNTSDRTTSSEVMVLCYFKTHEDLQAFAHGPHHRKVWDWWNDLSKQKKVNHLSICHEVYCAEKGAWEGIYVNNFPSMFMGTNHWVVDKEGQGHWQSPRVVGSGRFRSAMGRMGKSRGEDNEEYGEEPYVDV